VLLLLLLLLLLLQIVIVMAMLVRVLTLWPALAGLGMTVAIIPLTMLLGKLMTAARKESVAAADARVKLTTEVITGVKGGEIPPGGGGKGGLR
jgi:ATP-binding cassette subfamily C (CFTR/MRP) protein 1